MAGLKSMMVVLVIMMVTSFQMRPIAAQTRHVVGDALGWTIPPGAATYTTWASQQNFTVGDSLVFNFTSGMHSVAEVSEEAYGPCASTNTLSLNPTGPATITLTRPGAHYFICTVVSHCQIGQKLSINVSSFAATTPESTPLSPPSIIVTPPSIIATSPSGFELSPTSSVIPPPLSSSPPFAVAVPATFLAVALAFFY